MRGEVCNSPSIQKAVLNQQAAHILVAAYTQVAQHLHPAGYHTPAAAAHSPAAVVVAGPACAHWREPWREDSPLSLKHYYWSVLLYQTYCAQLAAGCIRPLGVR